MNAMCKAVVVACVLALSVSSTFGQKCNGGVECILLDDCTGLYNQLKRNGNTPELTQLLRGLHCGFDGDRPKSIKTDLAGHKSPAVQQRFQQPKVSKNKRRTTQPDIFDPAFWGFTTIRPNSNKKRATSKSKQKLTMKPTVKPILRLPVKPTGRPIMKPTVKPTVRPTVKSILKPTVRPTIKPTIKPTVKLTVRPTMKPTIKPIVKPRVTIKPTIKPTVKLTIRPTMKPTIKPIVKPTMKPPVNPIMKPTVKPIVRPITKPAVRPIMKPAAIAKPAVAKPALKPIPKPAAHPVTKPTVKPINKATVKPILKLTVKPITMNAAVVKPSAKPKVQTPVNTKIPANRKICCPPNFQGTQNDASTPNGNSNWNGNTNGGGSNDWNRGGGPNTNTNGGSWNGGGANTNTNGGAWNGGGANTNTNGGSFNGGGANTNSNGGGGSSSDPTSLLPTLKECGIQNNDRIVGGTRADIDEHPWMALLRYDKPVGWGFYCGGVLISSRYILTAAHCVKGQDLPTNWRLSQVRLGEWNTSSTNDCVSTDCAPPVQDIAVEQIIPHEQYNPQDSNQHNDIALLRLARPATLTYFVKPICLPLSREMKNGGFEGNEMEVAGWGKTETRSESDVKLKVTVPVVSRSHCATVFSRVGRQIINKQLCAGGQAGKDSCRGDSGGPLMGRVPTAENWFVLGVVSYGPSPCGTVGWPGVYTRVGAYVDWILSKLRT